MRAGKHAPPQIWIGSLQNGLRGPAHTDLAAAPFASLRGSYARLLLRMQFSADTNTPILKPFRVIREPASNRKLKAQHSGEKSAGRSNWKSGKVAGETSPPSDILPEAENRSIS